MLGDYTAFYRQPSEIASAQYAAYMPHVATRGHGTHTIAAAWKHLLEELLATSAK